MQFLLQKNFFFQDFAILNTPSTRLVRSSTSFTAHAPNLQREFTVADEHEAIMRRGAPGPSKISAQMRGTRRLLAQQVIRLPAVDYLHVLHWRIAMPSMHTPVHMHLHALQLFLNSHLTTTVSEQFHVQQLDKQKSRVFPRIFISQTNV